MNGYKFVHLPGIDSLLMEFKKCPFHPSKDTKFDSIFDSYHPPEDFPNLGNFTRCSWFLTETNGPFGELVPKFKDAIAPLVHSFLDERPILKKYYPIDKLRTSLGIHLYELPEDDKKKGWMGLPEHMDVDILTVLASDGPLDGFIEGEWRQIEIPKDHVMVFTDLTTSAITGERPLLHRVSVNNKFSIGAFIGAPSECKFEVTENADEVFEQFKGKTVGEFQNYYFTKGLKY